MFHSNCVHSETRASCVDPIDAACYDLCRSLAHYCQKHARDPNFLETNLDEEFNIDATPYFYPSRYGTEEDSDDESGIASSEEAGLNLIEKLRRCECRTCSNGVTWLSILGGGFNEKPHEFFTKQCLCEKTEQPDLDISVDKRACKLHDWECGMGTCNNCSIASRLPWDCPVFNSNTDKVNVWIWERAKEQKR